MSGVMPSYSNGFGNNIHASDVVQQAIYSIVAECKKLDPVHVRKKVADSDFVSVADNIQSVLDAPNPLMTTSDFIEKIVWTLLLNYNSFVYPMWEGNNLKYLYPLQPQTVEFDPNYGGTGATWVRFRFANGDVVDLPYDDIIHLRYRFSVSEFMGGNESGNPDFAPLMETLKLNDTLLKGLAKSLHIQTSVNGIIKIKRMADYDEQVAKVKEFERKLQANESGLLTQDISTEYVPLSKQVNLLDAKVLEFIDRKILRNWGVSIPIVNGDYTAAQYEAFYQKAVEPIVKTLNQAFTKGIFSKRQAYGFNNKIVFYTKELIFLNTDQKIKLFDILVDSASCYKNEMRAAFGLRPLKELEGQLATSSNKENALNNKDDGGDTGAGNEEPDDGKDGGNNGLASGENGAESDDGNGG
jgi:HK97 family phage portal protein